MRNNNVERYKGGCMGSLEEIAKAIRCLLPVDAVLASKADQPLLPTVLKEEDALDTAVPKEQ